MKKTKEKDRQNIVVSDIHAGSSTSIFPPSITLPPLMELEGDRKIYAQFHQLKIYDHLMAQAKRIKQSSLPKTIIFNGDLIEGTRLRTIQLSVPTLDDMRLVAIEIMETFLDAMGFSVKNGDELYITSGTEVHTEFTEAYIARHFQHLGAVYCDTGELIQNGRRIWFTHQWVGAGKGHNEGNAIYNGLKAIYYDCLKEKKEMPDLVIGSHFHKSALGSYSQSWNTYYGIISPSLQMKTRHALKVSGFQRNDIGIIDYDITAEGAFIFRRPVLMP